MAEQKERASRAMNEALNTQRWIAGKSRADLLVDLRVFASRLASDPHNLSDRLRVAAIQLRLGRINEALVHYDGAARGYAQRGKVKTAIALCQRVLSTYPEATALKRTLGALRQNASKGRVKAAQGKMPRAFADDVALDAAEISPADEVTRVRSRRARRDDDTDVQKMSFDDEATNVVALPSRFAAARHEA